MAPNYRNNTNLVNNGNNTNQRNQESVDNNHSILDIIAERTSNIEFINVMQLRRQTLDKNIKDLGQREANLRETTITFNHNKNAEDVIEQLERNWVEKYEQAPLKYWNDLDNLYVQFPTHELKLEFFDLYASKPNEVISANGVSLLPANPKTKQHITRKPVKCEIMNVGPRITATKINNLLNQIIYDGEKIINIREGKQHGPQLHRQIMFTVDAHGLNKIISEMDGHIQYNQPNQKIKTQLNIKVNCKPWQCKKCFKLGKHDCSGEVCGNCGRKGHSTRDCKSKGRHCNNCNKPGHRARDSHCQVYQNEIIRELRKMDVPTELMRNKEMRAKLISLLHVS